ncbi:MAG: recombinase family protein [Candidatus Bipolaricaulota bacterium]
MNVVLYARVSSDRQSDKGLSIPAQFRALHRFCDEHGHVVLREFVDDGVSGTTDRRPGFLDVIRFCKVSAGDIDAILVWKFNRFSRDRVDSAVYKRLLRKLRINVISITEPIAEGIDADLMEAMLEALDDRFSKSLAQDVMRGVAEATRRGFYPLGTAPIGYVRVEVRDGKAKRYRLEPDPLTAPLVRRIFSTYIGEGIGAKEIAKRLSTEGLTTQRGKRWTTKAVLRILSNPIYIGTLIVRFTTENAVFLNDKDREVTVEGAFEPLIDKTAFESAQRIRAERAHESPKGLASEYLLSGLLRCGICGERLNGVAAKSSTHFYYACRKYYDEGPHACKLGLIHRGRLDAIVLEKVRDVLLEPAYLAELAAVVNAELGGREAILADEQHGVDEAIKKTRAQLDRLLDALENGVEGSNAIRERVEERERELELLKAKRLTLRLEEAGEFPRRIEIARVLPYVESLKETLATAPTRTQRFILKSFIKTITVRRTEIAIEFTLPAETRVPGSAEDSVLGTVTSGTPDRT